MPPEVRNTATLLRQITGSPVSAAFDRSHGWRYRFDLTPERAADAIALFDRLAKLQDPIVARLINAAEADNT